MTDSNIDEEVTWTDIILVLPIISFFGSIIYAFIESGQNPEATYVGMGSLAVFMVLSALKFIYEVVCQQAEETMAEPLPLTANSDERVSTILFSGSCIITVVELATVTGSVFYGQANDLSFEETRAIAYTIAKAVGWVGLTVTTIPLLYVLYDRWVTRRDDCKEWLGRTLAIIVVLIIFVFLISIFPSVDCESEGASGGRVYSSC